MATGWCVTNTLLKEEVWCCTRDEGMLFYARAGRGIPGAPYEGGDR
jgi:hypothetical protein